jgi:hypothetical protein
MPKVDGPSPNVARLVQNADSAGISPAQLQQLLKGVEIDSGFLGIGTTDRTKSLFAGAATELGKLIEAREAKAAKEAAAQAAVVAPDTAPGELPPIGQLVTDTKAMMTGGDPLDAKKSALDGLVARTEAGELPAGEFVQLAEGIIDGFRESASQVQLRSETGTQLGFDVDYTLKTLSRLADVADDKLNVSTRDVKGLLSKTTALQRTMDAPNVREPSGEPANLDYGQKKELGYLADNQFFWGN